VVKEKAKEKDHKKKYEGKEVASKQEKQDDKKEEKDKDKGNKKGIYGESEISTAITTANVQLLTQMLKSGIDVNAIFHFCTYT